MIATQWTQLENAETLLKSATQADGVEPFSEQFVLGIGDTRLGHRHLAAKDGETLVGLAAVSLNDDPSTPADVELVVHPEYRRAGIASSLIAKVEEQFPKAGFWAHGNLPAAKELARSLAMNKRRRLLVMSAAGDALTGVDSSIPAGYVQHSLDVSAAEFGREFSERAWLEVNNDAFSWHPEQGGWDLERLHRAQEVDWYSDKDFLLLWDIGESEPQLAGFHWTKWQDKPGQGEVYVVGLSSDYRGKGLGGPVVAMGMAHLVAGGASEIILYVEDDNEAAVSRYEKLGFGIAEEHVVYGH